MKSSQFDILDPSIREKVYTQNYDPKGSIDGVKIVELKEMAGEDSDFTELMRLNEKNESQLFPGFHVRQINRSTQLPRSVKAWHLHLSQDEVWYVPNQAQLLAALWDVRKDSPTRGNIMRIPLGSGVSKMLFIPHGVAHGSASFTKDLGVILYFMNNLFDAKNPDEHRIPWDTLGADFWQPQRD